MAQDSLPNNVVLNRMKDAQQIEFDLKQVCSEEAFRTINAHSRAIGAPPAFIFFPLITVIASCMGVKAMISVNEEWQEPAILWTVVAARMGEKKTPACKRLISPISKLEAEIQGELQNDDEEEEPAKCHSDPKPQLRVDQFSFEELFNVMNRSGCQILAIYDEVRSLFQQLDLYKPNGSKIDKTTLLSLFNGGSWNRNFKNNPSTFKMESTAFNYTGFIQPQFLVEMLQRDDQDGFYDRLMIACPAEVLVSFRDLEVPMPTDIVDFFDVFKAIRKFHVNSDRDENVIYTFSEGALEYFSDIHDNVQQQKANTNDENKRGHLIKALTQVVRLAGIIHVMERGFEIIKNTAILDKDTWSTVISVESLKKAWKVVEYSLLQKWALMPPSFDEIDESTNEGFLMQHCMRIEKFLGHRNSDFPMTPSRAVRFRLVPKPVDTATGKSSSANAPSALKFMEKLQDLGFGELKTSTAKNKHSTSRFVKRKYSELGEEAVEYLKKLKMPREKYDDGDSTEPEDADQPSCSKSCQEDIDSSNKEDKDE